MDNTPFSPDLSNCLVTCDASNTILIHALEDLTLRFAFKLYRPPFVSFDARGDTLVAVDEEGEITIIDPNRKEVVSFADVEAQHIRQIIQLDNGFHPSTVDINPFEPSRAILSAISGSMAHYSALMRACPRVWSMIRSSSGSLFLVRC
jgi:hypothetical protein